MSPTIRIGRQRSLFPRICALAALCSGVAFAAGANLYLQTNLVANASGTAAFTDPHLLDPWGLSFSAASPFWVSNHLNGTSTLYNGSGAITPLVVTIPCGAGCTPPSRPTGQVNNSSTQFLLANAKPASFIFATEDGTISAWNGGAAATIMVDNSAKSAVYKGLAIGTSANGPTLYAADFRSGAIDVFDGSFKPLTLAGSFTDPQVPAGFAPFNIWPVNGSLYVMYAKQDANKYLDVAGPGNGYVSVFDFNGNLTTHLIAGGVLSSPWGVAMAPAGWGTFGGDLLIGNFGDGTIHAFDPKTGNMLGTLEDKNGNAIANSGLWAILFGNGGRGGDPNTLYFTAGVASGGGPTRGLLGSLAPPAAVTGVLNAASYQSGSVAPGEIVLIGGQTVGPSPAVIPALPKTGDLPTTLGGAMVTFNGTPAPIIYSSSSGTSVQVPYEVASSSAATILMTVGSQTTPPLIVPVMAAVPGVFSFNFSGTGQAVAFNQDGTLNSSSKAAARGSNILFFATGLGSVVPADTDGAIDGPALNKPFSQVAVSIGGQTATLNYAESLPGDVTGVMQISATIPQSIATGAVPVTVSVAGATSQGNITVFVQ